MLEDFQGDSWGSIPPLRMSSLLPHDLCHGRSASLWPPTCQHHTTHEKYQSESWMILAFKELTEKWGHMAHKGHRSTLQYKWELARQNLEKRLPDKEKMLTESQLLKSPNSKGMSTVVWIASFYTITGFPDSSVYKESTWNAGDPSSIPGLGRSAGDGIGYPLQCSWASLVAQLVKNLPAMWETWVRSHIFWGHQGPTLEGSPWLQWEGQIGRGEHGWQWRSGAITEVYYYWNLRVCQFTVKFENY